MILADFSVHKLGVEYPDYFQGFGSENYEHSTYGIGDTDEAALDDCMENMAQAGVDFSGDAEQRIRAAYGETDKDTTAQESLGLKESEDTDFDDHPAYFHVGIRWNE